MFAPFCNNLVKWDGTGVVLQKSLLGNMSYIDHYHRGWRPCSIDIYVSTSTHIECIKLWYKTVRFQSISVATWSTWYLWLQLHCIQTFTIIETWYLFDIYICHKPLHEETLTKAKARVQVLFLQMNKECDISLLQKELVSTLELLDGYISPMLW